MELSEQKTVFFSNTDFMNIQTNFNFSIVLSYLLIYLFTHSKEINGLIPNILREHGYYKNSQHKITVASISLQNIIVMKIQ